MAVTSKSISKWETRHCLPDASKYNPLCEILDITVNELFSGERINSETEVNDYLLDLLASRMLKKGQIPEIKSTENLGSSVLFSGWAVKINSHSSYGNRTRDSAVRGQRLDLLTNEPFIRLSYLSTIFLKMQDFFKL